MSKSTGSNTDRETRKKSTTVDYDDSTDDEKVTTGVRDYDLVAAVEQFTKKQEVKNHKYGNPESLQIPFALHAFGRGVYFSEPVGAIYEASGGLKETHLASAKKVIGRGEPRKTLPESTRRFPIGSESFEDEIDFISNKRLADRSFKRHGKNKNEEASANTISQKVDWVFSNGVAKQEMGLTPNNKVYYSGKYPGNRNDWVDYENQSRPPYLPKSGEESVVGIANYLKNEGLTDQQIATHVRQAFKGDQIGLSEEGKKRLVFLTSLLFGPETSRNPAGYVTHQMFLDLIEGNHSGFETWEGALRENKLPMMIGGAIAASRKINDLMNDDGLMPVVYHYDYNIGHRSNYKGYNSSQSPAEKSERDAKTILRNEDSIARDWLRLNSRPETFESLAKFLPEKIAEWYRGVDLSHFSSSIATTQSEAKDTVSTNLDAKLKDAEVKQDQETGLEESLGSLLIDDAKTSLVPNTSLKVKKDSVSKVLKSTTQGKGIGDEG
ncbi:MAG: hypothetical protein ISQ34_05380 [Rickettsiales bacterium]|nr:hypothetical protein [Rickettsiales bacterium]